MYELGVIVALVGKFAVNVVVYASNDIKALPHESMRQSASATEYVNYGSHNNPRTTIKKRFTASLYIEPAKNNQDMRSQPIQQIHQRVNLAIHRLNPLLDQAALAPPIDAGATQHKLAKSSLTHPAPQTHLAAPAPPPAAQLAARVSDSPYPPREASSQCDWPY